VSDGVDLLPCPFCQGPPVACDTTQRGDWEGYGAGEGQLVEAFIFCHECGAQGPTCEDLCAIPDEVADLKRQSALAWNQRDARHRGLFEANASKQLNVYPRADGWDNPAELEGPEFLW
jgi:hypothetical protein